MRTDSPSTTKAEDASALRAIRRLSGRFYAISPGAPRDRHPTDVILLVAASVVVLIFGFRAGSAPSGVEQALINLAASLPGLFDSLWRIGNDLLVVWAVVLVVVALSRRQSALALSQGTAVALVLVVGPVVGRLANGEWPAFPPSMFDVTDAVRYPSVALAVCVSVVSVSSPYLTRPFKFLGRWLTTLAGVASFVLGVTMPGETVGAMALGSAAAAAVHLFFGSPANLPKLSQVRNLLATMGVVATPVDVSSRNGVVRVRAEVDGGADLDVKIYGRDAWDGQLLVTLWRQFWYRQHSRTLAVSRIQQVEHEAFLTLLAEQRGVPTYSVVAAGKDIIGDAVLVLERRGELLNDRKDPITDEQLRAMWRALADLEAAGIAHGAIDSSRVFIDGSAVGFADLSSGAVLSDDIARLIDRAQLLVTTATLVGQERALAAALDELGPDGLADATSLIQPAALTSYLRECCEEADLEIDDLSAAAVTAAGGQPRELQRLRRVTVGGLLTVLLLFIAANVLISGLIDIGIDTIVESIQQASVPLLILAFLISCSGRVANAFALTGISPIAIPLGRLTALQFAQSFVSLAMPSTAARVAVNVRFFQRSGVEPTTAVAIGALDGFTGFLCQMFLLLAIPLLGLGSLNLDLTEDFSVDDARTLLVWLLVILAVAIIVIFTVARIRNWLFGQARKVRDFTAPLLHSPRRVVITLGGNLAAELIGALTQYTVLVAFDQSVDYLDVVLVGILVSLFSGLMPVPGGIGVTEAALTAGFISLGIDPEIAFAAAITVRMITFYLPPVIGVFVFRWMQRQKYL